MANYVSQYTGIQHDSYVTKSQLVNLIYPVGSIYISVNSTSPEVLFGGTWVQIKDKFLLSAGNDHTLGDTGGKEYYEADDMPAHTHDRGTMDITGVIRYDRTYSSSSWSGLNNSTKSLGCFTLDDSQGGAQYYNNSHPQGSGWYDIGFKASNNWTGETSQSGLNEQALITPPTQWSICGSALLDFIMGGDINGKLCQLLYW